jgi:hypothetical protein
MSRESFTLVLSITRVCVAYSDMRSPTPLAIKCMQGRDGPSQDTLPTFATQTQPVPATNMPIAKYELDGATPRGGSVTEQSGDAESKVAKPYVEMVDYAGAAKVVDPAEIKLVRKLDRRIMVSYVLILACFV